MKPLVGLIIKSFDFSGALIVYIAFSGIVLKYISPVLGGAMFVYTFIAFYVSMGAAALKYKPRKEIKEVGPRPKQDNVDIDQLIKESRSACYVGELDELFPRGDNERLEPDFDEAKININQTSRRESFKKRHEEVWENYAADWSQETLYPSGLLKQDIDQNDHILEGCESEPEKIFLSAMIDKYQLISHKPFILTGGVTVELQRVIGSHRVDFLINNRFVVEIDGRRYHEKRFYGDRMRDQDVIEEGFIVIRFPAAQVYRDAQGCCDKVENIIKAHS